MKPPTTIDSTHEAFLVQLTETLKLDANTFLVASHRARTVPLEEAYKAIALDTENKASALHRLLHAHAEQKKRGDQLALKLASVEGKALDLLERIDTNPSDIQGEADALAAAIENPTY